MGAGEGFVGQIDLLRRRAFFYEPAEVATDRVAGDVPAAYADAVEAARREMIEKVAEGDDALMHKYVHEEPISEADIRSAIRRSVLGSRLQPVLCGSALRHMGVRLLLDAVCDYLPSPLDVPAVSGPEGPDSDKIVRREVRDDEAFSALVFKIVSDQHGDLYFTRWPSFAGRTRPSAARATGRPVSC